MRRTLSTDKGLNGVLEKKVSVEFCKKMLTAVPSDLLTMRNLVTIDLSCNQITRFPGEYVASEMVRLEVLLLQQNLLYVLEDILELSTAPRLRELNLSQNPLRLLDNRVYLLEALINAPACDEKTLRTVQRDTELKGYVRDNGTRPKCSQTTLTRRNKHTTMKYIEYLPRRTGFPMLQRLNDEWISDADLSSVERERGQAISHLTDNSQPHRGLNKSSVVCSTQDISKSKTSTSPSLVAGKSLGTVMNDRRSDGSRMTVIEMIKREARSSAIPPATIIQRCQIDIESGKVVEELDDEEREETHMAEDREIIHQLFGPNANASDQNGPTAISRPVEIPVGPDSTWSYPISTFDELESEERQYVRYRSKQGIEAYLQRDDHFFESSVFLDCVAQAERSRRLTIRAVDVLCPSSMGRSQSTSDIPAASLAAIQLKDTLTMKFNKSLDQQQYAQLQAFRTSSLQKSKEDKNQWSTQDLQVAVNEHFANEHVSQKHHTTQLLQTAALHSAPQQGAHYHSDDSDAALDAIASSVETSLSKLKLQNAVDLANAMLLNKKQEKRMMQMLIEADARVIEQERAALEQALHRHRLELIETNQYFGQSGHDADRAWMQRLAKNNAMQSPWQARNWRAKEAKHQQLREPTKHHRNRPRTANNVQNSSNMISFESEASIPSKFRTIETVDDAVRDRLPLVNSHDLLVRCADIRQHADEHVNALSAYRDQFVMDESEWETMRQDPITVVRRHLNRELYQNAQEIQTGSTQLFYSTLFH